MSNTNSPANSPSVKNFMSQVLLSLKEQTSLEEAAAYFAEHRLTTIPVLGQDGKITGVLTDFALLRFLIRARQEPGRKMCVADFKEELDPVVTIHEDDSIVTAFRLMIQSPNHRIYATHEGGLAGALSPKDLLLYMAGIKREESPKDNITNRQIEEILAELNETRRLLSDYQQMFQDSPYLMHSVDLSGKIINANRMIHAVLGYEEGELVGRSLRQLYVPENYKTAMQGLETVRTLGFHPLVNVVMARKDGNPIRVDVASTLKKDSKGNPEGTITVGRLSDSYRMLNYLQKAAQVYAKRPLAKSS